MNLFEIYHTLLTKEDKLTKVFTVHPPANGASPAREMRR